MKTKQNNKKKNCVPEVMSCGIHEHWSSNIYRRRSVCTSSFHLMAVLTKLVGPIAGRSGIESRWGRGFPSVQIGPGAHPASCKMGTGSFPWVKCGQGVLLTTHPLLVPRSWKSRTIPLPTLWATPGL